MLLDGDDALHPEAVEQRVAALLASDLRVTVAAAGGAARVRADWVAEWDDERCPPAARRSVGLPTSLWTVGVRSPFGVHQVLLRRDALDLAGAFDEDLRHGAEDMDLWLRLLRRGYAVADTTFVDCYYRQRPGSMIEGKRSLHLDAAVRMLRVDPERDSGPDYFAPAEAAAGRVVAERVFGWCVLALLADEPAEALESLRMLTPAELMALRVGVNLDTVTAENLRRAELRFDSEGANTLDVWHETVATVVAAVRDVAFGTDPYHPTTPEVTA